MGCQGNDHGGCRKRGKRGKGDFGGAAHLLYANFLGEGYGSDFIKDEKLANEVLGLPKQGLEETVKKLVEGRTV